MSFKKRKPAESKRAPEKEPRRGGGPRRKPGARRRPARSPDDERGTPHPGDFPNPLRGIIRDCF